MIKVINWNINSIKSRLNHLLLLIKEEDPDIIMLQELKCETDKFPYVEFETLGYNLLINGQKTYNGVAILSKYPCEDTTSSLPSYNIDDNDQQARYIETICTINKKIWRFISVYVPNGQEVESEKYSYKLNFLERLHQHLNNLKTDQENLVIGGDFNIANQDIDVYDPKTLTEKLCFSLKEKKHLRKIINSGFSDTYRLLNQNITQFSWWDYRAGAYQKNNGLRIDYIFSNHTATNQLKESFVLEKFRTLEKPSDHIPIVSIYEENT